MAFHVKPREVTHASKDASGLPTHLSIVERRLEMSDASQTLILVSELIPNLVSAMQADVLIVGQSAVPI